MLFDWITVQMIWHLVRSSWILHISCNKRKVAPIAALLSSVLHSSLFSDKNMHVADNESGPLKWVCSFLLPYCLGFWHVYYVHFSLFLFMLIYRSILGWLSTKG